MARRRRRRPSRLGIWLRAGALALAPLYLINGAVAVFGQSPVFPLSPFFLEQKVQALGHLARHLPGCLLRGHAELGPLVADAERRHGLPPGLLAALVTVESGGRVHRISPAGAMGPGQLMPGTARQLRVEDPFDPATALDASARYLARQLQRFGDVQLALAAYNAGPGNVQGRVPHNGETEHYVRRVVAEHARLAGGAVASATPPEKRVTTRAGNRAPPTGRRAGP